jgi:integrase
LDLQFVLYCGFFAGYRKNEIIESRPDWFDMSLKHVHVKTTETFKAKDKEERTIPMADEFYKFLKKYGKHEPFSVPSARVGNLVFGSR